MKKLNKKLSTLAVFSALCLGGCGAKTVEDFMDDPEALQETLQECMLGKETGEVCRNAAQASQKMVQGVMQNIQNMGFGQ